MRIMVCRGSVDSFSTVHLGMVCQPCARDNDDADRQLGKTISIKALMRTMTNRKNKIPCLYVKSAPQTYMIASVFSLARMEAPCLLVFEDIDTIVTPTTRSYFFNEVDGVANNDGIMMVASTNYLDRLDPGLTQRPSRFDRKYLFPLPNKVRDKACLHVSDLLTILRRSEHYMHNFGRTS
jgi:AAA+ superfamily predicted ATPase